MKFSRELRVDADYHQFYVLDSSAALDATGALIVLLRTLSSKRKPRP